MNLEHLDKFEEESMKLENTVLQLGQIISNREKNSSFSIREVSEMLFEKALIENNYILQVILRLFVSEQTIVFIHFKLIVNFIFSLHAENLNFLTVFAVSEVCLVKLLILKVD